MELGSRGIECNNPLEVYDPVREIWVGLPWAHTAPPIPLLIHLFLVRYEGVTELHGFDAIHQYSSHFPLPYDWKGKARVK